MGPRCPREVVRVIVPIPVSPFLNHPSAARPAKGDEKTLKDGDAAVSPELPLLRNVLLGLTSAIDPRASVRAHGRTLRFRLGFFGYWFSPTGLYLPGLGGVVQMLAPWIAAGVAFLMVYFGLFCALAGTPETRTLFGCWPLFWLCSILLLWVVFRYLDWRSLIRHSARLYDLIHAEETKQKLAQEHRNEAGWKSNWSLLMLVSGLAAGIGATLLLTDGDPSTGIADWLSSMGSGELAAGAAILAGVTLTLTIASIRKRTSDTTFGWGNPDWLIVLLRRYLFLLHRFGIEPVLVVDELDRLEAPLRVGVNGKPEQFSGDDGRAAQPELDAFVNAMVRLKNNLGKEFFWILIGGPGLVRRFQQDADCFPPGPLSTMVKKGLVLGAARFEAVAQAMPRPEDARTADGSAIDALRIAWLRGRGRYAVIRARRSEEVEPDPTLRARARLLCACIEELWDPGLWSDYLAFSGPVPGSFDAIRWQPAWVREGMLDLGEKLLYVERSGLTHRGVVDELIELGFRGAFEALSADNVEAVAEVGRRLLYQCLVVRYMESPEGEPPQGIKPFEHSKDEPIRFDIGE